MENILYDYLAHRFVRSHWRNLDDRSISLLPMCYLDIALTIYSFL